MFFMKKRQRVLYKRHSLSAEDKHYFPGASLERCAFRPRGSLSLHKHCETQFCARRIDGHFRTVGLSLKFHPSAFVVHGEGREDKQVHMYKEIIPGLRGKKLREHRAETSLENFWGFQDSRPAIGLHFSHFLQGFFLFSLRVFAAQQVKQENHADSVSASLLGCVSHAVKIPRGRLRGDRPHELQRHQELARCFGEQRLRHCQSESAHLSLRRNGTQNTRGYLAGKSRA